MLFMISDPGYSPTARILVHAGDCLPTCKYWGGFVRKKDSPMTGCTKNS